MEGTTLAEQLQAQRRAVAAFAETPWSCLDDGEVLAGLEAVLDLKHSIDALHGALALAAEQSLAVSRAGARNVAIWVGANTSDQPSATRAAVRRARWLLDFAEFAEAHADGRLSAAHVEVLRQAQNPTTHLAMRREQAELIQYAVTCTFKGFETAVQYWVNAVDPDGTIPAEQERKNTLSLRRYGDGSVTVKGRLDPILGTKLHNAVMAEAEKLHRTEQDGAGPRRHTGQRRAEALVNLVERGHENTNTATTDPLLHVVMSQRVAEDLAAGRVPHIDPFDPDARCEFLDGTPLHPCLAARLMAAANVRRVVLDAQSEVLDVSVKTRLFPRWMKQAALVGTRGRCKEAGCDAPTHWIHADHRLPHAKGGETRFDNLDPLCAPGNRAKGDSMPNDGPDKPGWRRPAA